MSKIKELDLTSENLVESIIKRKGGSVIPFGHGHHKRIEYHFKPVLSLPDSPHVCIVDNDEHRKCLLEIKEGFRLYNAPDDKEEEPAPSLNKTQTVDYEDLLGLNADEVTTDWLKAYAKDHLKISPTSKAQITEYAKLNYSLELEGTMTSINMLREVMKAEQSVQQKDSDAAELENK